MRDCLSLFSGAGGLDLGLEKAGFRVRVCLEADEAAVETLSMNVQNDASALQYDLTGNPEDFSGEYPLWCPGAFQLLAGGPPCQAFSTAGKREGAADARGKLVYRFIEWVNHFRPEWFVFENVKGLASAALVNRPVKDRPPNGPPLTQYEEKGSLLESMFGQLPCEYRVDGYLLNAADFGVPQFRERMFFFGNRLNMTVPWPQPTHGIPGQPYRTLRDAIWHLRDNPGEGAKFSERQKSILKDVPPGGNWRSLPKDKREVWGRGMSKDGGNTGWWRRLSWDAPSPTILTQPNHAATSLCHPDETRPLSLAECAAIQGFPPDYPFQGKLSQKYTQVGNAVPVGLAEAVGRAILSAVPAEDWMPGWTWETVRPLK